MQDTSNPGETLVHKWQLVKEQFSETHINENRHVSAPIPGNQPQDGTDPNDARYRVTIAPFNEQTSLW